MEKPDTLRFTVVVFKFLLHALTVTCCMIHRFIVVTPLNLLFIHVEIHPPTNIDADTILITSINFSWSESTCSGSCPNDITGYSYMLVGTATNSKITNGTTGADERMVTITGLTPCTQYEFGVAGISGTVTSDYRNKSVTTAGEGRLIFPNYCGQGNAAYHICKW